MAPTISKHSTVLARVNFPLYCVQMLTPNHILVAGGGGSSKTGVANGFEIFEISHNGVTCVAEEVIRHETGQSVVMNCAIYRDRKNRIHLAAGQEGHCQLYEIKRVPIREHLESFQNGHAFAQLRNCFRTTRKNGLNLNFNQTLSFNVKTGDSVLSDAGDDACQRVVRVSGDGKLLATGGTDGHVKLWTFPKMELFTEIKAHKKEVDDLDFSFDSKMLVSVAKDGKAVIWSCKDGKMVHELKWSAGDTSYLYKRCRFSLVNAKTLASRLFLITNPLARNAKCSSYLQLWNPDDATLRNEISINENLSSLAVDDLGKFVAIGTMFTGSISIYVAFSLQKIFHVTQAHSMFITGLEFLPSNNTDSLVFNQYETALVSISVDNKICIHCMPKRQSIPVWIAIMIIIITLGITFIACALIDL